MPGHYLIAYDIANPKRLAKIHRYLKKYGMPIQYSVFYVILDERKLNRCLNGLEPLIHRKEDDVRCYPLPKRGIKTRLGKASLPQGVFWTGLPESFC